jgi:broad specificity phosphatase PhoE
LTYVKESYRCYHTPLLNELRWGDLHNLSREEIQEQFPEEYAKKLSDRLRYRYPGVGGESYLDVIERIRPVIIELERQRRSVLVVCHQAVVRCIHAYFMGTPLEEIPTRKFQRHVIYELTPGPFGCVCREIDPSKGGDDGQSGER